RHTRFSRDWSSDVCSSDLLSAAASPTAATIGATELLVGRNDLQEIDVGDNGRRPGQAVVVSQRQVVADKVTGGDAHVFQIQQLRSEERRVGKGCRCRCSQY